VRAKAVFIVSLIWPIEIKTNEAWSFAPWKGQVISVRKQFESSRRGMLPQRDREAQNGAIVPNQTISGIRTLALIIRRTAGELVVRAVRASLCATHPSKQSKDFMGRSLQQFCANGFL